MDSDNEPEIIFKWTNSCRLCLSTDSNIDLFSQESSQEVLKKIRSCFNLLIYLGDPMPRKLCTSCLIKLDDWFEFKENCLKVENDLKRRLENYRKIDFVQDYFDKCARFSSSEVVSSSKVSATHEEINSSVISNVNDDDNRSNSTNSSQTCGSSNYQEGGKIRVCTNLYPSSKAQAEFHSTGKREIALQVNLQPDHFYEHPYSKEPRRHYDDEVVTIENITGSASDLWDVPLDNDIEEITEELIHHEIIIKQEINTTTCTNCGIDFPSDEDYAFHTCSAFQSDETDYYNNCNVIRKLRITPWKCEACGDYYQTKSALNEHYSLNCKGEQYGMVSCRFCKRKFISEEELYQHQLCHVRINFHLTEDDMYCCRRCPLRFCSEEDFNKHYGRHLTEEASYACDVCGRMFTKKDVYLAHVKHHNTSKTEMMKLKLSESLMDTSSQESGSSASTKRCFRCGKFFADEKELEQHRLSQHKNPTPFNCRLCNHKFSARSQLLFHLRSHRGKKPETGEEVSKSCGVCHAKFMLSSDLQSHMMTHNNQIQTEEEIKPPLEDPLLGSSEPKKDTYLLGRFKCSLCPRIFARLNSVPKHMRIAHGGQPGAAFKLKRPVWVNKWSNLPLPYKKIKFHCNLCPKYFYSKDNLNLHVEKGHSIKKEPIEGESSPLDEKVEETPEVRFVRKPGSGEKQCMICKNIYSKKYIHQHMKRAHPDYKRTLITGAPVVARPAVIKTPIVKTEEKKPEVPVRKKILKCRYCFRLCYNEYAHRRHEDSCAKIQKAKCTVCGIRLHSKIAPNHVDVCKSIRCRKCNKIFFKYIAYLSHTCAYVRGEKFKCADCFAVFQSRDLLDLHLKEVHGMEEATVETKEVFPEVVVEITEGTAEEPKTESLLVAKSEPPEEYLDVLTETNNDLTEAPALSPDPSPAPAPAPAPIRVPAPPRRPSKKKRKKGPMKELWLEESNKIVIRNQGKYYCTYCDVYFFSPDACADHQTKHPRGNFYAVQIDDNLFQCTICDKKYNFRKHCLIHVNYHKKNSKRHKRLQTKKKNIEVNNVREEEAVVVEEQKLYQCPECPSAFTTERSYNIHSYYVHSNNDGNNVAQ